MTRRAFTIGTVVASLFLIATPASAGGGGCGEVTEGSGTTVEMLYACLTPTMIRVDPGDRVTFVNRDDFRHVIAGAGYAWGSDGYLRSGEAFTATFRSDGVYPFQCYLHPGMTGAVIVGEGTGLGAADVGGVIVEPLGTAPAGNETAADPEPEIRTVVRRTSTAGAWATGIAVGAVLGALLIGLGLPALRRRNPLGE